MPISGFDIGGKLAAALGLKDTTFLQITVPLDGPVEVSCRFYPDAEAMAKVHTVLLTYQIAEQVSGTS
jgi:hypothetical protein